MTRLAYVYIWAVILAGLLVIGHSALVLAFRPISNQWLLLAAVTLLTGSFSLKIPSVAARISVTEAFVFASVLLFGPATATAIVALDSFVMTLWLKERRFGLRALFNFSAVALAIWVAAHAFFLLAGVPSGNIALLLPLEQHLWHLFVLASLYFLLNSWLVAIALSFERHANVLELWWNHFPWFSLNYFGGVSVAALLVSYTRSIDVTALSIVLPLLVISYLTYRTSTARVNEAHRHVEQVQELYMSTIETLAMAVDAKDQITHGHIRRVQVYAVELAKRLGFGDERQLKAIATAALLHDMGKLAIPEHILNKPGKLTPTEFDKMKLHADIGADLLSSVKFPYPVVPLVRHHHENWDGTGYPAAISGTDIPLGARILSVVDCFDALTSDRPYRPRMSIEDAFAILRERRGTMYDPLVVDMFIASYAEISPAAIKAGQEARSMMDGTGLSAAQPDEPAPFKQIRANASEASLLNTCEHDIAQARSSIEALQVAAQCLRQLTPATVFALFTYDPRTDLLTCGHTVGDAQGLLRGLTIRLGERVTGWSAANMRTSFNSDPRLDLIQIADLFSPPLRSTFTTPLVRDDRLVAVLTAYSARAEAFTEGHRYTVEQVASALRDRLASLTALESHSVISFPKHRN